MPAYFLNDYVKFIGEYITVVYEYGNRYKKVHCKLLDYYEKNSKEKYIILKSHNNINYHINCDKIIYWIGDYNYLFTDNKDNIKSNSKPKESNTSNQDNSLPLEKSQYTEITPSKTISHSIQSHNTDILQNKKSKNINNFDSSLGSIDNSTVTYNFNNAREHYKKNASHKNNSTSPLATFINYNFQGVYLTIYTASAEAISGEVIFNFDYLVVLKSSEKTYYINPAQITHFC